MATAPLHPLRVVQDGLGFGYAGALGEHDQVVVAVGGAEDLVPAAAELCTVTLRPPKCEGRCTTIGALVTPSSVPRAGSLGE
ncbi:hypothetical protein [Streptomyces cellulosae]|uniref:hypothetical protein n=1 Tax=Streptomyces cellulosae TaxID=1968 RepID=UPI00131CCDB8